MIVSDLNGFIFFLFCKEKQKCFSLYFFLLLPYPLSLKVFFKVTPSFIFCTSKRERSKEKTRRLHLRGYSEGSRAKAEKTRFAQTGFCFFTPSFPLCDSRPSGEAGSLFKLRALFLATSYKLLPVFFGVTNVTIITVFICIPFLLVWWYVWAFFCCNVCNAMAFLCLFFLPSSNPLRIPFLFPSFLHGLLVEPWRNLGENSGEV